MRTTSAVVLAALASSVAAAAVDLAPVPAASLQIRQGKEGGNKGNSTNGGGKGGNGNSNGNGNGKAGGMKGNSTTGGGMGKDGNKGGKTGANSTAPVKAGAPASLSVSNAGGLVTLAGLGVAFAVFM